MTPNTRMILAFVAGAAIAGTCCAAHCTGPELAQVESPGGFTPDAAPTVPADAFPEVAPSPDEVKACANLAAVGCPQPASCAQVFQIAVATQAIAPLTITCLESAKTLASAQACAPAGQVTCADGAP